MDKTLKKLKSEFDLIWHRIDEGEGYVTFALYPTEIRFIKLEKMEEFILKPDLKD